MPRLNLAYVAGIVDGEGCIGFGRIRGRIYPRVFVTNTNLELLESLKQRFGGDIRAINMPRPGWKQGYHWRIANSAAVNFVDQIYPWLRVKADQALLLFGWDAIRPGRGGKWSPEGRDACALLDAQRKWLNFKGSGDPGVEPMRAALEAA